MELPRLKIGLSNGLPVYIKDKERYTGIVVVGKSGTGKSSLLSNWWESDCYFKKAKILIEPSGFLSRECYSISKKKHSICHSKTQYRLTLCKHHMNQIR
jgi:ABC-type lipoprotein export system ATPase subunit